MKTTLSNTIRKECGGAFIWALILLMVGSLTLPPLMSLASNAIEASQMYERKTFQAYAADAGIEDGLWEIKYGDLDALFTSSTYDPYDYGGSWSYNLSDQPHGNTVNGYDPEISLKNVWIPIPNPPPNAQAIIEGGKLIVTGDVPDSSTYRIRIQYYPDGDENMEDLIVESVGVWLPNGFSYNDEINNSLEEACDGDDSLVYCDDSSPAIEPHNGGTSIVWDFSSTYTAFADFVPVDEQDNIPWEASVSFEFTSQQEGVNPSAVAWFEACFDTDRDGCDGDTLFSWDADTKIYEITSVAGDASVTAHVAKNELRDLGSQINGDYRAIGGSLMTDSDTNCGNGRDYLFDEDDESAATVNDIPSDAEVARAYLYWSGWVEDGVSEDVFYDECTNFTRSGIDGNWTNGANWDYTWYDGSFRFEGQRHSSAVCTTLVDDNCTNFDDDPGDSTDVAWIHNNNWSADGSFVGEDHAQDGGGGTSTTTTLLSDGFEATSGSWDNNWDSNGATSWDQNSNQDHSGYYSARSNRSNRGNFTSDNLDTSDAVSINIDFWYRLDDTEDNDLVLYYYNGSSYVQISQIGGAREDRWHHYTDTITDSRYFDSNFRIRFDSNINSSWENVWIDDVVITKGIPSAGTNNYLTMASGEDLRGYSGDITVSWDQDEYGRLESSDCLEVYFLNDSSEWIDVTGSSTNIGFCNDNPGENAEYVIGDHAGDAQFRHDNFRVQFRLSEGGFDDGLGYYYYHEYCYIDDFVIEACNEPASSASDRYLTLYSNINLDGHSGDIIVSWDQSERGSLGSGDCLEVDFLNRYGLWVDVTDTGNAIGFCNDYPGDAEYVIGDHSGDDQFRHASFRIRFRLSEGGWDDEGEYCYIDNIEVSTPPEMADTTAIFEIDDQQVYFDGDGLPQQGAQEIIASQHTTLVNNPGYSYSCYLDVTELVREFSATGDGDNHPGNGKYTVGGVHADTRNMWSYAGWSLIIIYESAQTKGQQLYLYDDFIYSPDDGNVDFDNDGEEGGQISGFIIPDRIGNEANAAKLTCFVGEGDDCYSGDSLEINGYELTDYPTNPYGNVWNSQSPGLNADGVDIDTFNIRWEDNVLNPGDTSAQIDLNTATDSWNMVYIILAIRSETTTGGTLDYLLEF